jgi:uncharacterized protein (DUF58 family)
VSEAVPLTDPAFIRRLEGLNLLARKVLNGRLQADRLSTQKGAGITFADYAEYHPGDDHRAIDWRVYARFETLGIKLFEMEEDATIAVVIDRSASMQRCWRLAREIAAAISYIALHNLDRVAPFTINDRVESLCEPCHGRGTVLTVLSALQDADTAAGSTDFANVARALQVRLKRRALVVVISDFFFPGGFEQGLDRLQWHGHDIFCLQVQDPADQSVDWRGDVELACAESGATRQITVGEREARAYAEAVQAWNQRLVTCCARRGFGHAAAHTGMPFDEVVRRILRRGGLVA